MIACYAPRETLPEKSVCREISAVHRGIPTDCSIYEIYVPRLDENQLDAVFAALLRDNPDIFFTGRKVSHRNIGFGMLCSIDYILSQEEYETCKAELDAVCDEVIASLSNPDDEWQTELEIHDYIIENCRYELDEPKLVRSSAYGALVEGRAACEGYSKAAKLLFDKVGMASAVVSGISDNGDDIEGPHMWNAVEVNGDFYYLDCTWDDPVNDSGEEMVMYAYFNLNDEMIASTHSDFSYDFGCTATAENYYIKMGSYFESYDRSDEKKLGSIIAEELNKGGNVVQLRFGSKTAYNKAISDLVDSGRLYDVLKGVKRKTKVKFSTDSLSYYRDSGQYLLTLVIER